MINLKKARKLLGKDYENISDTELERLVGHLYILADIISSHVKLKISNKTVGVIDPNRKEAQNETKKS